MNKFVTTFRSTFAFAVGASVLTAIAGAQTTTSAANAAAAQQAKFTATPLGSADGATEGGVLGINASGDAVGYLEGGTSTCSVTCAVVWHNAVPTLLAVGSEYGSSDALSINNSGQILGNLYLGHSSAPTAVVWNDGTPTVLPGPNATYLYTYASSINDAGQVAGYAIDQPLVNTVAIEWSDLKPSVLGVATGCIAGGTIGTGINNRGTVVGLSVCAAANADNEATVWRDTEPTLLGPAGNGKSFAVNNNGLVVGQGPYGATAWIGGAIRHLATGSTATAVNNLGIIVGKMKGRYFASHAVIWDSVNSAPVDLNDLIGKENGTFTLTEASGINDSCDIAADGFSKTGHAIAFILKPVDPSDCAKGF